MGRGEKSNIDKCIFLKIIFFPSFVQHQTFFSSVIPLNGVAPFHLVTSPLKDRVTFKLPAASQGFDYESGHTYRDSIISRANHGASYVALAHILLLIFIMAKLLSFFNCILERKIKTTLEYEIFQQ